MRNETYQQYVGRVGFENAISEEIWGQIQTDLEDNQEMVLLGGRAAAIAADNISFLNEMLGIYLAGEMEVYS